MRTRRLAIVALAALAAVAAGCAGATAGGGTEAESGPVLVFAAASLRDVALDLGAGFERRHGREVVFNFAGSNTLAQQVRAAPRADVFLSADEEWVRFVERAGATVPGSVRPVLANRLVAVAHRDAELRPASLAELAASPFRRLALADPAAVPAGRYARGALERDGLWPAVAGRVVPALDVRAALALVASDPQILGIVYRTDVVASDRVRVLFELAPRDDLPIVYWAAAIRGGPSPTGGGDFLRFLTAPAARAILADHGFETAAG